MLRRFGIALSVMFAVAAQPARSVPHIELSSNEAVIPFDPPLGTDLRYRWQATESNDGRTTINWSTNSFRFEEATTGYRLIVEPVSSGSNEEDPFKLQLSKRLDELTRMPFVLRLSEDAEIVELERGDEYWQQIIGVLREELARRSGKPAPQEAQAIASVIGMFETMPSDVRLAKLTESVQPLVEFASTETIVGKPIHAQLDTASPFGGTLKQDAVISLTKVERGLAHLTIRMSVSREELLKVMSAFVSKLQNGELGNEQAAKMEAALASLKEFRSETIAEYRVSLDNGMLDTFNSTQTISVYDGEKRQQRVKTISLTRLE